MNARDVCIAIWKRRPTKLSELEEAIGPLHRDPVTDAYHIRRDGLFGFQLVSVAFIGHRLRDVEDPDIVEITLRMREAEPRVLDLRALAIEVLGPGVREERTWPDLEMGGTYYSRWLEWRDGVGAWRHKEHDVDAIEWTRARRYEAAKERSADEAQDLVGKIVALVAQPFSLATIEQVFGPLDVDGRGPDHAADGRTWFARAHSADALEEIFIGFTPDLASVDLVRALGWRDVHVRRDQLHDESWTVHDDGTNARVGGGGVEIVVHIPHEHDLAERRDLGHENDYEDPYAIAGAPLNGITIRRRSTSS